MRRWGLSCIRSDNSIYVLQRDAVRVLMPVFVDDGTLASNSESALDDIVSQLSHHFKLRDLGPTSFLLGIHITRDRPSRSLSLSQRQYIVDTLARYSHADCKPVSTPILPGLRLSKAMSPQTEEEREYMHKVPYGSTVGSLLYIATTTRPDISFAVSNLCPLHGRLSPQDRLRCCQLELSPSVAYSAVYH